MTEDFMEQILSIGKDIGFGTILMEMRIEDGNPVFVLKGVTDQAKYPDNDLAIESIVTTLKSSIEQGYTGSRTFTVVFDKKGINRIMSDNYQNITLNKHEIPNTAQPSV